MNMNTKNIIENYLDMKPYTFSTCLYLCKFISTLLFRSLVIHLSKLALDDYVYPYVSSLFVTFLYYNHYVCFPWHKLHKTSTTTQHTSKSLILMIHHFLELTKINSSITVIVYHLHDLHSLCLRTTHGINNI